MNAAPFSPSFPVRSLADMRRLEETPLSEALTVRSTYEIFRNSAAAFGDKTALTFLRSGDPARRADPLVLCRAAGRHPPDRQPAARGSASGPDDAVAVLLPGCLEYHLALWGGEAAGIVQPLNPLLTDEKLVSLMTAGRAKVLIAYGSDDESGMWSKAMRLRGQVPTLTTVLRVAPHDERRGQRRRSARRRGRLQCAARARAGRPARERPRHRARATSPPTSTPAAPPARPSWRATAMARRCSPPGPA